MPDQAAASGLELRPAHFPGRAPVDAYGDGGFRFAEMSHKGSMLFLPSGIYAWNVGADKALEISAFDTVIGEADAIEVLLIGTGIDLRPIPSALREVFRENRISADSMSTGAAVRTFNVLLAEGRAVAAAFIAV